MRSTLLILLLGSFAAAQDWPQFRGPDGQGHSEVKRLPVEWSDTSPNLTWKTPIDGLGWSSPVVSGGRLWITTATDGGKSLRAICLDAMTGKELHSVEVFRLATPGRIHPKNSHASPSPILDGDHVYVHFGPSGTACLSKDGQIVWKQEIKYAPVHGPGGSMALYKDLLIFSCDGSDKQFVVALGRKDGKVRWTTPRTENPVAKKFAFSTPLVIDVNGKAQLLSPTAGQVTSYEPETGKPIWQVRYGEGYSIVPRPVYGQGLVFLGTGFDRPTLIAIKPDGKGDVTDTHVAWRMEKNAPLEPSPLLIGEELYVVSDQGVASCLDAKTGKVHWQERIGGTFSSSPLYGAERIYFLDENGATTVLKPGKTYSKIARNEVSGKTYASLAPVEGALFLRTDKQILRIEADPK